MDFTDRVEPASPTDHDLHEDPTLAQDMRSIAGQVRTFAEAELAFQKARAAYVGSATRSIALLSLVAAVLAFFAAMAAVLGTVIALGPVLGLWGAMAAVTVVLLAISVISALLALSRAKRMRAVLGEGGGDATGG